jgi:hypothetical protein
MTISEAIEERPDVESIKSKLAQDRAKFELLKVHL